MKSVSNWNEIEEQGNSERKMLPAGGYIGKILTVEDLPDKQYLKITWDISEGEYKGNGASCLERNGFLPKAFSFIRSYKESALRSPHWDSSRASSLPWSRATPATSGISMSASLSARPSVWSLVTRSTARRTDPSALALCSIRCGLLKPSGVVISISPR